MRIAVLGVGAIGGLLAARLVASGASVSLVERPRRANLLREHGLRLESPEWPTVTLRDQRIIDAGCTAPHDLVILAVKAHEIASALPALLALLHEGSTVLTLQNGLPWWYFQRSSGEFAGRTLTSLDPDGRIGTAVRSDRILGCVAYPAADLRDPCTVTHVEGLRFPVGEPDGTMSARATEVAAALVAAGFKAPVLADVRAEIWLKTWGNLAFNPISALTGATMAGICGEATTRALAARMMTEAQQVAARLGIGFRVTLERRLQGAEAVGEHKTSMLQDLELGRPLEYEAVVGAVREIARMVGLETPTIDSVYGLVRLLDRTRRAASPAATP